MIDKKLITNLEKEIEFLKSEITTKNEMIKKRLSNDIRDNNSCITVGEHGTLSIDDQLKMIRKKKHQENLLNTGCKSPFLENTKITKTPNDSVVHKPEKKT